MTPPPGAARPDRRRGAGARLASLYLLFALFSAGLNLGAQLVSQRLYDGPWSLGAAMGVGTGIGLIAKYLLDKRWIFRDASSGLRAHGRAFSLYSLMGLFTTAIFWGTELLFAALAPNLTLAGGALGLAVGYAVKYQMDKRFVFRGGEAAPA